jgi:hypothetical protein
MSDFAVSGIDPDAQSRRRKVVEMLIGLALIAIGVLCILVGRERKLRRSTRSGGAELLRSAATWSVLEVRHFGHYALISNTTESNRATSRRPLTTARA